MSALPSIASVSAQPCPDFARSESDSAAGSAMPALSAMPSADLRPPLHLRSKSENADAVRRDLAAPLDKVRLQSSALLIDEPKAPYDPLASAEFKKSKSLTRKIRELNQRESPSNRIEANSVTIKEVDRTSKQLKPSGDEPLASIGAPSSALSAASTTSSLAVASISSNHITSAASGIAGGGIVASSSSSSNSGSNNVSSSTTASASSASGSNGNSASRGKGAQLQTIKPPVHIPSLTLDRMASGSVPSSSGAAAVDSVVFQHFSLPKSITASSSATSTPSATSSSAMVSLTPSSSTTKLASLASTAAAKPSSFSNKTNVGPVLEFVYVEEEAMETAMGKEGQQQAAENDRILQARLQEAKALNRKDQEHGATMFTFSLWKKPSFGGTTSGPSSCAVTTTSVGSAESLLFESEHKSMHKLRGPKAVLESYSRQVTNVTPTDLSDGSDGYSDDDFVEVDEEHQEASEGDGNRSVLDTSILSQSSRPNSRRPSGGAGNVSRNLAAALRSKVVDAQQLQSPTNSPMRPPAATRNQGVSHHFQKLADAMDGLEVTDDLETSYSSFANHSSMDVHSHSVSVMDEAVRLVDDVVSDESVHDMEMLEESHAIEDSTPSGMAVAALESVGDSTTIHTLLSKSGPAAIGSSSSTGLPPAAPMAQTLSAVGGGGVRRASTGTSLPRGEDPQGGTSHIVGGGGSTARASLGQSDQGSGMGPHGSQPGGAAVQFKSLTSRDPRTSVDISTPPSSKKLSKYQVLRNLRSANKKLQQLEGLDKSTNSTDSTTTTTATANGLPGAMETSSTSKTLSRKVAGSAAPITTLKKASDAAGHNGAASSSSTPSIPSTPPINAEVGKSITNRSPTQLVPLQLALPGADGGDEPREASIESGEQDQISPLKWKKGEAIGEGTFGRVFKGLNEKTGELLAIKQLCLADGSEHEVEELRKEINVMWELDHENIVRYLGTNKTDRFLFIILEFVTGGSVASMLAQFGPFTESLIRRFSYQILSGVSYLHSKGIIHRDIKGANILVTDTGIAKLADFGCSKRLPGLCSTSLEESMLAIRGSIPWMAPEVIKQSGCGRSSDIWSFGATVIEMASGKPPWSEYANNLAALFHVATTSDPPPTPEHLSTECKEFLKCCLVIDPDKRSTSQNLLNHVFVKPELEKAQSAQSTPLGTVRKRVPPPSHLARSVTGSALSTLSNTGNSPVTTGSATARGVTSKGGEMGK